MMELPAEDTSEPVAPVPTAGFWSTLGEGFRSLAFMAPRWERVSASPRWLALFLVLQVALNIGLERSYIDGPANFYWNAGMAGWGPTVLLLWTCYLIRWRATGRPHARDLMTMVMAQTLAIISIYAIVTFTWQRSADVRPTPLWLSWISLLTPIVWISLARLVTLLRTIDTMRPFNYAITLAVVALSAALSHYLDPNPSFWYATSKEGADAKYFQITQEVFEEQAPLLGAHSAALLRQRPGIVDLYTITFAPYATEDVFKRESAMVADVMAKRFDAAGRGLQLLNHMDTADKLPWATPLNLERAIGAVAKVMDRNEDVLFIHLTSHGAQDGELAARFYPLEVEPVMPPALRGWLDKSGIKYRVLSISACYSGSWIKPLASDDTLVMTAADAHHTSYGCGHKSPLTFFGRAMYDEQLRNKTLSFEEAHAAARKVIEVREKEAGKDDGYSNPQISVGRNIGPTLKALRERVTVAPSDAPSRTPPR